MNFIFKFFGKQYIPFALKGLLLPLVIVVFVIVSSVEVNWYEYDLVLIERFLTVFLGITMQSFPFLMAGALLSSVIHEFVPDGTVEKLFKKRKAFSIPAAILAAFLFPVCDCASVPVAARFCKKGFPVSSVIVFMLASPIINPVVIASTWYAFGDCKVLFARAGLGIILPVIIGLTAQRIFLRTGILKNRKHDVPEHHTACGCDSCSDTHEHAHIHSHEADSSKRFFIFRLPNCLAHAGNEFISVLPFIIVGAIVSSGIQVFIPKDILFGTTGSTFIQSAAMLAAAFALSICSTSDAFFARSFLSHVSMGPAVGFMTAGPMIDFKNILMMSQYFRKRFILFISIAVFLTVFASSIIIQAFVFGGL